MTERRIFSSGRSKVLALPPAWAEKIIKNYQGDVVIKEHEDLLLVSPSSAYYKFKDLKMKVSNPEEVFHLVTTAYLGGADDISLDIASNKSAILSKLGEMKDRLIGVDILDQSSNKYRVSFNPRKYAISELVDSEFKLYEEMQKMNQRVMEDYPVTAKTKTELSDDLRIKEHEVDKVSYLAKRLLFQSLTDFEQIPDVGLCQPADVLSYSGVERNIERLSDLQEVIFSEMLRLNESFGKHRVAFELTDIIEFYKGAHELADRAYISRDNMRDLISVIKSKTAEVKVGQARSLRNVYETTKSRIEKMPSLFSSEVSKMEEKERNNAYAALGASYGALWTMHSSIWGMVGNASNIAESWLFIYGTK